MVTTRLATDTDDAALATLLAELARHDPEPGESSAPLRVAADLLRPSGRAGPFCLMAFDAAKPLGFAALSGLLPATGGRWGLFLQLLFVTEPARGGGAARALMAAIAQFAVERGYTRVDWNAIPSNAPATGLYRSLGVPVLDRVYYRLDGALLADAARTWPEPLR
jgi:GNAT superfamily N-acetyltransferase